MKELLAYCGLPCHECEAFQAKRRDDPQKRAEVAERWSKVLKTALGPEDIYCDGCKADSGLRFRFCASCAIRGCAREKSVSTCAECGEYVCGNLERFFEMVPASRKRLESIHGSKA